jgi:hypothetical protein
MFRKVVFSKDPIVLRLESMEDKAAEPSAYILMKHKQDSFLWGSHKDHFGLYHLGTSNEPYLILRPDSRHANEPALLTSHIHSKTLSVNALDLDGCKLRVDSKAMTFELPADESMFQFKGNQYPDDENRSWFSIGRRGVGIGTGMPNPLVSLHVNGTILCDRIVSLEGDLVRPYRESGSANAGAGETTIVLDSQGKIPMAYLPEVYQTSLIQNDIGVGIGTRVPCQKLHLEGSGYIRDRLGVGTTLPTATVEIQGDGRGDAPVLSLKTLANTPLLVLESQASSQVASFGSKQIAFGAPTVIPHLTVMDTFEVKNLLYRRTEKEIGNKPGWVIPESLYVVDGLTTNQLYSIENRPFTIHAPKVCMETLETAEWESPMNPNQPAEPLSLNEKAELFAQMAELTAGIQSGGALEKARWDWDTAAWKNAYEKGQDVAQWLLCQDPNSTETRLRVSSTLSFLWSMVQLLTERVKALENSKN